MRFQSVLTSIIALTFATSAFAQDTTTKNVLKTQDVAPQVSMLSIEPVVGGALSTFQSSNSVSNIKYTIATGGIVGLNFILGTDALQFETGALLASRGTKFTVKLDDNTELSGEIANKYLDVPLLGRYTFMDDGQFRFFVKGGLIIATLQSSEVNGYAGSKYFNIDSKDGFKQNDIRTSFSVGSTMHISEKIRLVGTVETQTSLDRVTRENSNGESLRISAFGISVGLGFEI